MFSFKVKMKPDTKAKLTTAALFGQFILTQTVIKDSNYYVPMDENYLERSALIHSDMKSGRAIWQTPYARRLYYNPQYNFSTDKNPNARGFWFENAKAQALDQWLKEAELAMKSKI